MKLVSQLIALTFPINYIIVNTLGQVVTLRIMHTDSILLPVETAVQFTFTFTEFNKVQIHKNGPARLVE